MTFLQRHLFLFETLVSALFILLLLWRIDVPEALRRVSDIDGRWAALGVAGFASSKLVQAYRWRLALWHRKGLSFAQVAAIYLVSALANALVPLRGGDLLRVQMAARRFNLSRAEVSATVFAVETPLNWITLVTLVLAGLLVTGTLPVSVPLFTFLALLLTAGFVGAVALARLDPAREYGGLPPVRWLPRRMRHASGRLLQRFLEGMESLRDARLAAPVVAVCFVIWLIEVAGYWCLGRAFGLDLSFTGALLVMTGANLILSTPLTPGHVGPFQVAVTEVAVLLGVDRALAGSYAIASHLLLLLTVNVMGIAAAWTLGLSPRDLFGRVAGYAERPASQPSP